MALEIRSGIWHGHLTSVLTGEIMDVGDIGAVWMRKKAGFGYSSSGLSEQEMAFCHDEMEHLLLSLLHSLDCYWMSHPSALRASMWKGEQLQRAARYGFTVPSTCLTNQRVDVERLRVNSESGIVFKTMSSPTLGALNVPADRRLGINLGTTIVSDECESIMNSVSELPGLFQSYVPKAYELRVTVVDDETYVARIESQSDPRTVVDYRDFSAAIRYAPYTLPQDVDRRCREFVGSYGLTFGAIDLIYTPDGDFCFLENNPGGQFLFVEEMVPELGISNAIARKLIAGAWAARPSNSASSSFCSQ